MRHGKLKAKKIYPVSRSYPRKPLVGVGAVVIRGREVLLVRRAKAPAKGRWSIPGGGQRLGETVRQATLREVLEETAVAIEITSLLDVVDFIDRDDRDAVRHHYTLVDFAAIWLSGEAVAGDDALEVAWARVDDLARFNLLPVTADLIARHVARLGVE